MRTLRVEVLSWLSFFVWQYTPNFLPKYYCYTVAIFIKDTIMTLDTLHRLLVTHAQHTTHEYTRLFHGRGNTYGAYPFLTVDSVDKVLFVVLFDLENEEELLLSMLEDFYTQEGKWEAFILQRRYLPSTPSILLQPFSRQFP